MCKKEELETLLATARRRNSLGDVKGTCNLLMDALALLISKKDGCCGAMPEAEKQVIPVSTPAPQVEPQAVQVAPVVEAAPVVEQAPVEEAPVEVTPTVEPVVDAAVEEPVPPPDAAIRPRHRQPKV